jgi:hypothetical protein
MDLIKNILVERYPAELGLTAYMTAWKEVITEMEGLLKNGIPEDPSQLPILYPTSAAKSHPGPVLDLLRTSAFTNSSVLLPV